MAKEKVLRDWLNPKNKEDTGHIKSSLHANVNKEKLEYRSISAELEIADCSRKIELNLYCDNQQDAKLRLLKLNILIKHIEMCYAGIETNMHLLQEKPE
jgi:hypothetical protein